MTDVVRTEEWIDPESQQRFRTVDAYIRAARVFTGRSTDHTRAGDANAAQADTIAQLRAALAAARPLIDVTHPDTARVRAQVESELLLGVRDDR